jgi:hypothetical protein
LLPEFLDDYVAEDNPVRVIDAFVDELDLRALGFEGVDPEATGRPAYHPATMLGGECALGSRKRSRGNMGGKCKRPINFERFQTLAPYNVAPWVRDHARSDYWRRETA